MKIKLHHILIFLPITFAVTVGSAYAQEASMEEIEINDSERDRAERERIISSPGEGDTRYATRVATDPSTKDSAQTSATTQQAPVVQSTAKAKVEKAPPASAAKPVIEKQEKNQDDSILSFNFLYYIIEKYKLQDIVD